MLLGAPTGSGKTLAAELAIFRIFNQYPGTKVGRQSILLWVNRSILDYTCVHKGLKRENIAKKNLKKQEIVEEDVLCLKSSLVNLHESGL